MPLIATRGAASAQGFGEFAQATAVNYIENVFSTYLYTGTGVAQTITNGIDLAGKGGLVWLKSRSQGSTNYIGNNLLYGSAISYERMYSNADSAAGSGNVISVSSTGFTTEALAASVYNGDSFVSWTFREQPKFFDVVTYTGDGTAGRTVAHNLGSVPGCIIVKNISRATDWIVYHTSIGATGALYLNTSTATVTATSFWNNTSPTSTQFTTGTWTGTNYSGDTFVAYLFAHNAGGFGLAGTDNVISCGTFTTDGTGAAGDITLGYESQLVMFKRTDGVGNWQIVDTMRGSSRTSYNYISPTVSSAESSSTSTQGIYPTATGFYVGNNFPGASQTYVYIAIRRGPMAVPTLGTSVFTPTAANNAQGTENTTGFPLDMQIMNIRSGFANNGVVSSRLTGVSSNTTSSGVYLRTPSTGAESASSDITQYWSNTGFQTSSNWAGSGMIYWSLRRAPGFFDVVCYTGTGTARTISHNLTAVPEFIICKNRTTAGYYWRAYLSSLGVGGYINFGTTDAAGTGNPFNTWNNTAPTSSVFSLGADGNVNANTNNFVAYLFATCPGVSKVGSYTGTGALQTVACGFTSGARFVLIKRTDSTGDWYVWDSARGITSGNDPYLLLNDTAAEVTGTNYVDTDTTGFQVTAAAPAALNANGGTYIFLAIA
jgi:hypothetical protein